MYVVSALRILTIAQSFHSTCICLDKKMCMRLDILILVLHDKTSSASIHLRGERVVSSGGGTAETGR